ncbi:VPLPA-CTERM sorting domain-containing protein (plasmid) [Pseudorhodobacter turbinis]|uniref:VPLPA-CTERM sorting domain-containing protein n=1 Tax=Pseudorhodobacter turbinis TaxID=2500533 RepID=A0A4V1E145_9RHOB|nr:VPLPA-CTERM sorting domain-containing protein [Pseudorhodobacter turbinis]QCO56854.1 VPLPA-CTERM sorting domain-containing protein [Pseudorhodobacter turbinis]
MNVKFLGASVTAAMLMTAVPALAATIMFDDFSGNQTVVSQAYPGATDSSTVAFGAGTRTLTVNNVSNNGNATAATTLEIQSGELSFSNNDRATGTGTLTYTSVGDISNGSNPYMLFRLGTLGFDHAANFTATAIDTLGNVSTYFEVLVSGVDPKLFLSAFAGSADFDNIATLSFEIDSSAVDGFGAVERVDGSITSIELSPVPLPASGLLLFGALGGAAAMRRRKARKAA